MTRTAGATVAVALIAVLGTAAMAERSEGYPPSAAPATVKPATTGIAAWDDETLGSRFLETMKQAGYAQRHELPDKLGRAAADQVGDMARELEKRGNAQWETTLTEKRPADAHKLTDTGTVGPRADH
jgi:hypothetical protein